jgi:hypothetical protein
MAEHTQNQRERLNYLEFKVFFTGQVSRADLMNRFGISEAAATRDLTLLREEIPGNLEFDSTSKIYRMGKGFSPYYLKEIEPNRLLRALVHGIGDDFGAAPECLISCELPARLRVPPAEILAAVSRAIFQNVALQIEYLSDSGNHGPREIVPFSLAGTGLKWMVRAFCRRKGIFCDFILNRIKSAEVLQASKPKAEESKEHDDEWNRMLKLELVPHPAASPEKKALTEQEFQMVSGAYTLRVRAALAGYVLRLWSVDCSEEQKLTKFPLALRNIIVLHDVDSATLAPGYTRRDMSNQTATP